MPICVWPLHCPSRPTQVYFVFLLFSSTQALQAPQPLSPLRRTSETWNRLNSTITFQENLTASNKRAIWVSERAQWEVYIALLSLLLSAIHLNLTQLQDNHTALKKKKLNWSTSAHFTRRQWLLGTINAVRNSAHHLAIIQCHGNNLAWPHSLTCSGVSPHSFQMHLETLKSTPPNFLSKKFKKKNKYHQVLSRPNILGKLLRSSPRWNKPWIRCYTCRILYL